MLDDNQFWDEHVLFNGENWNLMKNEVFDRTRYSLLSRLKNWEDQQSWQEFYDTYRRLIYGVALKSGLSEEEAEEVLQETVITVAKNIGEFRRDPARGTFKSWLMHTTRWRIQDQLRKRKRAESFLEAPPENSSRTAFIERVPDQSSFNLETLWDGEWEKNLLDMALEKVRRRVDPARYQAYDLHVLRSWPVQKVAEKLGLTAAQVYTAKYKVSGLLKNEVENLKNKML
jgi:RNA polymerase sigma factor (sigma-70 family)